MWLDHLLSKRESKGCFTIELSKTQKFGGDALRGNTRSHPEHDG